MLIIGVVRMVEYFKALRAIGKKRKCESEDTVVYYEMITCVCQGSDSVLGISQIPE